MKISPMEPDRLAQSKKAYTARNVNFDEITTILTGEIKPQVGDLVLAKVEKLGQHYRINLGNGRRADLFPGDEIVVCYGNRYAPDQFEAEIPEDLSPCNLAAAGGLAAKVLSGHKSMKSPTVITPIGLLANSKGRRVNLADYALPLTNKTHNRKQRPLTIAVVGACMNAGKTTTAANLIKGLVNSGMKVGAAKITGTGAVGDIFLMQDAGAYPVLDFTDCGFPSTYRVKLEQILGILETLTDNITAEGVDAIVLEIADGLFQEETAAVASSLSFRTRIDGVIYAAATALGIVAGIEWLRCNELPVLAASGLITTSPLASREAEQVTGLPLLTIEQLRDPAILARVLRQPQMALSR
jgi:molybdopterin-guanine dinucleotide biosynthesis protein